MKKFLSIILTILMVFSVASVSFIGASAAEPVALQISETSYEIKVNQTVTAEQAKAYAEAKFAETDGTKTIYVIYADGETMLTKEPAWKAISTFSGIGGRTTSIETTIAKSLLGYIIANIAAGKADYYVYGYATTINPFLYQAVKVTDVNNMDVTTDITTADMAIAVAYGLLKNELASATSEKPIYAVYAQKDGSYSVIKSTSYDGTNIWGSSIFTYSASDLATLAGEGRLYVLSKNAVGNLWDQILEYIMNIINWIISLFQ